MPVKGWCSRLPRKAWRPGKAERGPGDGRRRNVVLPRSRRIHGRWHGKRRRGEMSGNRQVPPISPEPLNKSVQCRSGGHYGARGNMAPSCLMWDRERAASIWTRAKGSTVLFPAPLKVSHRKRRKDRKPVTFQAARAARNTSAPAVAVKALHAPFCPGQGPQASGPEG